MTKFTNIMDDDPTSPSFHDSGPGDFLLPPVSGPFTDRDSLLPEPLYCPHSSTLSNNSDDSGYGEGRHSNEHSSSSNFYNLSPSANDFFVNVLGHGMHFICWRPGCWPEKGFTTMAGLDMHLRMHADEDLIAR